MTNEEAIVTIKRLKILVGYNTKEYEALELAIKKLENNSKKGEWITRCYTSKSGAFLKLFECSECSKEYSFKYDFCPLCEADMREADNEK